jgi:hypothetical protein
MSGYLVVTLTIVMLLAARLPAKTDGLPGTPGFAADKDFFPIMPWDSLDAAGDRAGSRENGVRSMAACNFTVSAFAKPGDLPLIRKLGLKAMMRAPSEDEPWTKKWLGVPDDVIDASLKRWVEQTADSEVVLGYFITDEPGTPKFPALGKALEAVRKYAPGKLAYINLFPGYATLGASDQSQLGSASFTEYLERFVAEVRPHILSYDNYRITFSDNLQSRQLGASYFEDLLEVRRVAQKHGIPFWNTVCSNQIRPYTTVPSPANLLLQAYTTLAAGGRGLAWYTYYKKGYAYAPIDKAGNRTDTWYYLQMVNRQVKVLGPMMNRLRSTGVFFTDPAPAEGLPVLPGRLVEQVESRASLKGFSDASPGMMIGEFEGEDGHDYVLIVNLSLEKSANFSLHTRKTYSKKEVISAQDGSASPLDEVNGRWCVPGQGVLIRLVE